MKALRGVLARVGVGNDGPPSRRELMVLGGIIAFGLLIRLVHLIWLENDPWQGDVPGYDFTAKAFADGHLFWSNVLPAFPAEGHPSAWKPPGYWTWIGVIYTVFHQAPGTVGLVQTLVCGPAVIGLTWLLARRLFDHRIAIVAAAIVALYPNTWQFEALMYPEAIALPLALVLYLVVFDRPLTRRVAITAGVLLGISLLIRPTSMYFIPGLLAIWWVKAGLKDAARYTAVAVGCAVLIVAPWTIRNAIVLDGFIPISLQDSAISGTFNPDSANDKVYPYAWRPMVKRDSDILRVGSTWEEAAARRELMSRATDFIKDHPDSIPKAFFWNGLSRTWDIRSGARVLDEPDGDGRKELVTGFGLLAYWVMLPMALLALWRLRRSRRELVVGTLALAAAASVVFSTVATTRYRIAFEPLIAILAAFTFLGWFDKRVAKRRARKARKAGTSEPAPDSSPAPAAAP